MNYRRGGLRLLIVLGVLWSALWGANYYFAAQALDRHLAELDRLDRGLSNLESLTDAQSVAAASELRRQFDQTIEWGDSDLRRQEYSVYMGLGGLAVMLVIVGIGAWLWRGFRGA